MSKGLSSAPSARIYALLDPGRFHARAGHPYQLRTTFAWAGFVSPFTGRLAGYRGLERVRSLESFRDMTVSAAPGARITATVDDAGYPVRATLSHRVGDIVLRDLNTVRYLDGAGFYVMAVPGIEEPQVPPGRVRPDPLS
ncbi:hypothetical protein [Streptomyces sp. YIM S03343]